MSAHVEIISTDLRRTKIKVTPGTYLIDVLNEACDKLKLSKDKYLLKHKNRNVDLTGTYRTSGLSPGAKLDLVVKSSSPTVVNVGLTVAGRDASSPPLTKQLPSDMTLWQMLRQFESIPPGLDITARGKPSSGSGAGQLYYEAPVVNIMGKEYALLSDLQKTLSQCGINGGNMRIRVDFRTSDKTLFDALKEIGEYMQDVEPEQLAQEKVIPAVVSSAKTQAGENDTAVASNEAEPVEAAASEPMELDSTPASFPNTSTATAVTATTSDTPADPLQPTGVFSAPTSSTPVAARTQEDDVVYEPTIAHAQLRQAQLQERSHNTRLKSNRELEAQAAEKAAKLAKVTDVLVKVRFPDMTVAQWRIGPDADGAFIYQAVRNVMAHADAPFKLVLPGPATTPIRADDKKLIKGYGLTASTLLNLVWEDGATQAVRKAAFLQANVANKATDLVIPQVPQAVMDEPTPAPSAIPARAGGSSDSASKKLPKWLKLGGKK